MIIGTTSRRDVLEEMQMMTVFSTHIHVSNITKGEHIINVISVSIHLIIGLQTVAESDQATGYI